MAVLLLVATQAPRSLSSSDTSVAPTQPPVVVALAGADPPALAVALNVTPTLGEPGTDFLTTCNVTGGVPPYSIVSISSGAANASPSSEYNVSAPASIAFGLFYIDAGDFRISCSATDSASQTSFASVPVHVVASPSVTVTASPTTGVAGASVTFTATPQGGVAPFTYLWMGLPPGCPYRNASQVTCTPTAPGRWRFTVTVVDALGATASGTSTVSATPLVLGMPQTTAVLVLGGIVLAAAAALAAFLILRRRRAASASVPSTPQTEPPSNAARQSAEGAALPEASDKPPRPRIRSPVQRRAVALGLFTALSGVFYLALAWSYSFLSGFQPPGVFVVLVTLGLAVAVAAWRTAGLVLSSAGFGSGIALYLALAQPLSACTDSPAVAAGLGVPTCGAFALSAVGALLVAIVLGVGAAVFLLRASRIPQSERGLVALGTVVVALLIASATLVVTTPPAAPYPSNLGPDVLPFPLPAGSSFLVPFPIFETVGNFTYGTGYPQGFVPVASEGFAPAFLVGGWNASVAVCIYVQGFSYGAGEPVALPFLLACGTSVAFRFPVTPAVWQVRFSLQGEMVPTSRVTITQTIQVVY